MPAERDLTPAENHIQPSRKLLLLFAAGVFLAGVYQLVRNLLATCLSPEGEILTDARVVLLHDERNPAFQPGGDGWRAYQQVRSMLLDPRMLQRTSWQRLARLLRSDERTTWLADAWTRSMGSSRVPPASGVAIESGHRRHR